MKDKKRFIFLLFLILFFSLSFVSAEQQSLGWKRTSTCIELKQSYANSTYQNITAITLPDGVTIDVRNEAMTSLGGGLFNYSYCIGEQTGQYIVDGVGDVDGMDQTWVYDFYATPLGVQNGFIFYIIFIMIIVLIFAIGFTLENAWIMTLNSVLVLVLGLFVIMNGIDLIKNQLVTWPIGLVIWALGIYFLYLSIEEQLKNWK